MRGMIDISDVLMFAGREWKRLKCIVVTKCSLVDSILNHFDWRRFLMADQNWVNVPVLYIIHHNWPHWSGIHSEVNHQQAISHEPFWKQASVSVCTHTQQTPGMFYNAGDCGFWICLHVSNHKKKRPGRNAQAHSQEVPTYGVRIYLYECDIMPVP